MKFLRLLIRLWLGGTFLLFSLSKIRYPFIFGASLEAYQLVPVLLIPLCVVLVPWLELLAGICLILGLANRGASLLLGLMSATFAAMIGVTLLRGLDISCGCFVGENLPNISWKNLVFDLLLLGGAVLLYIKGPGPWTLDRYFFGPSEGRR